MASVSVSHLILFIAAMLVASSVAGILTTTVDDISQAIDDQGISVSDDIRSNIDIINDPGAGVVNDESERIELFVKNTGSTELTTDENNVDIFINGHFRTADELTIVSGEPGIWGTDDVARIDVEETDLVEKGEENRAQVRVDGAEDILIWEEPL